MPAAGIGLELVASITMPSMAHLPMSELGDLSLPRGREGVPQRLLRHRAGPTHQLGVAKQPYVFRVGSEVLRVAQQV